MGKQMTPAAEARIAEQEAQALASLETKVKKTAARVKFAEKQHSAAVKALAAAKKEQK